MNKIGFNPFLLIEKQTLYIITKMYMYKIFCLFKKYVVFLGAGEF